MVPIPSRLQPAYLSAAGDLFPTLGELTDAGDAVRGLIAQPGWDHVRRVLEAEIAKIDAKLDGGLLATRAEYAHAHGRRSGLRAMVQAADAIVAVADRRGAEQRSKHEDAADAVSVGG